MHVVALRLEYRIGKSHNGPLVPLIIESDSLHFLVVCIAQCAGVGHVREQMQFRRAVGIPVLVPVALRRMQRCLSPALRMDGICPDCFAGRLTRVLKSGCGAKANKPGCAVVLQRNSLCLSPPCPWHDVQGRLTSALGTRLRCHHMSSGECVLSRGLCRGMYGRHNRRLTSLSPRSAIHSGCVGELWTMVSPGDLRARLAETNHSTLDPHRNRWPSEGRDVGSVPPRRTR